MACESQHEGTYGDDDHFSLPHSLAHSDGVTALQLRGLFEAMASLAAISKRDNETSFEKSSSSEAASACNDEQDKSIQIAIDIKGTPVALDMREEVVETALVLLELSPFSMLKVCIYVECVAVYKEHLSSEANISHNSITNTQLHGTVQDDCQIVFRKRQASVLRKSEAIIDQLLRVVRTEKV